MIEYILIYKPVTTFMLIKYMYVMSQQYYIQTCKKKNQYGIQNIMSFRCGNQVYNKNERLYHPILLFILAKAL